MKKLLTILVATTTAVSTLLGALPAQAAGASVSGGGTKTVGQNFTVTVVASGAEFDSLQGVIAISGPVSIVSFVGGGATWLPGKSPANNTQFVGITSPTTKLTVASITLKGTKEGKGSVSVSGVKLARNGAYVGTSGGSTSFTITRALTPPGGVEVSSTTHPDQNAAYEATTVELSWKAPANGATGYSTVFDQIADTTPGTAISTTATTATFPNLAIGTYYFHIRANNGDGWGATTHFKITIKEPDPKVDDSVAKPTITGAEESQSFATDIAAGTVSGFVLKGTAPVGYVAILSFEAKDKLPAALFEPISVPVNQSDTPTEDADQPAGEAPQTVNQPKIVSGVTLTPLMAETDASGAWQIPITAAVPAGFYTITVQGQKEKVLTPVSDPLSIELAVAEGGRVRVITAADATKPPRTDIVTVLGATIKKQTLGWGGLIVFNLLALGTLYWFSARRHRLGRSPASANKLP